MIVVLVFKICILSFLINISISLEGQDVGIVIISQKEGYYKAHSEALKTNIYDQADDLGYHPEVILSHELDIVGSWLIVPLIPYLSENYPNIRWFFFCLDNTVVRLHKLLQVLEKFNTKSSNLWLGHVLYDDEPTIIHHFAERKRFKYPNIASGFAMNSQLVHSLAKEIVQRTSSDDPKLFNLEFSIDPSYEFATIVEQILGVRLTHVLEFCVVSGTDCATYPRFFHSCAPPVALDNIYFAVKTCNKYHKERIPVIKKTWGKHAINIGYYSDKIDENLSDAIVTPNTTSGHCAKTYSILKHANDVLTKNNIDWLVISDDDTIFCMTRLLKFLTCFNPKNPIAIGERYGFRMLHYHGYEYLTGGAGIILSKPLVHHIISSGKCLCPTSNTPDDMFLFGSCLSNNNIQPVHSPMFHQARPIDYSIMYLASQEPISFHKFWMIDPVSVYNEWFSEIDNSLIQTIKHTEL